MVNVGSYPVRKVVSRSTVRVVGYHASQKMRGLVPWESQIEKDYYKWLEVDPDVIAFYAQPRTFKLNSFRYTPDALVITHKGSFFVEVKPDSVLECSESMARLDVIQEQLASRGLYFRLILERDVRALPLRKNVVLLNRHIRQEIQPAALKWLQKIVGSQSLSIEQLIEEAVLSKEVLFQGIAQGFLLADLTKEIDGKTVVTLQKGRTWDDTNAVGRWGQVHTGLQQTDRPGD